MAAAQVMDHLEELFDADNQVRQAGVFFKPTTDFSGGESDGKGEADFQRLPARQLRTRAEVNVRVFHADEDSEDNEKRIKF